MLEALSRVLVERVQTVGIWVSDRAGCYRRSRPQEPICDGKHTSIDTPAGPVFGVPEPPRRQPAADRHRSRLPLAAVAAPRWAAARGLSTAPSAARSRRWSLPTSWLAGLLLLALTLTFGPGAFTAPLASVPVISRCCWSPRSDRLPWPDSSPGSSRL